MWERQMWSLSMIMGYIIRLSQGAADKVHELAGKVDVRTKTVHVFLVKFHLLVYRLLKHERNVVTIVGHFLKIINNLLENRNTVRLFFTERETRAVDEVLCNLLLHLIRIIFFALKFFHVVCNEFIISFCKAVMDALKHLCYEQRHVADFFFYAYEISGGILLSTCFIEVKFVDIRCFVRISFNQLCCQCCNLFCEWQAEYGGDCFYNRMQHSNVVCNVFLRSAWNNPVYERKQRM